MVTVFLKIDNYRNLPFSLLADPSRQRHCAHEHRPATPVGCAGGYGGVSGTVDRSSTGGITVYGGVPGGT